VFTGIIGEIGRVSTVHPEGGGIRFSIHAPVSAAELHVNDSVSVNGVCQTVVENSPTAFTMQAVEETLRKTTLGALKTGDPVNLELPVRMSDRLGGHLVLGHIDGVGTIVEVEKKESSWLLTVEFPEEFGKYVIPVGSIALDGISLTIAAVANPRFVVSIIPHTLERTTLARAARGMKVNLEFDLIGKYIERLIAGTGKGDSTLTAEKLRSWGYNI